MTARAIPVDVEFLGCANESGAFDPRGSIVLLYCIDGRDEDHPQAVTFGISRDNAEQLGRDLLANT